MSNIIFRTINGIVRPITISGHTAKIKKKKATFKPEYHLEKNHYNNFRAFTIPNVKCRKCGLHVYYYEHPSGSRVLFDELGPPWPLHPCFADGQNIKKKSVSPSVKTVSKKEKGWFPIIIEKAQLRQNHIEVNARTEKSVLNFLITASTLMARKITVSQIKDLLVLAKVQAENNILVQFHDGKSSWEQKATLSSLSRSSSDEKPAITEVSVLSEKKFKKLTPLQNGLLSIKKDKLLIDFLFYGEKHHQSIGGNQWHKLQKKLDHLKLYFRKDKSGDNFIFYVINPVSREFITFFVKGTNKKNVIGSSVAPDNRVKLVGIYQEDIETLQIKILGKIDDSYITFYMPRKYLRANENIDTLLNNEITIWLEHAGGTECHLSIDDALGKQKQTPRGKVSILSCTRADQTDLPEETDFIVENIDAREDAHIQLYIYSQKKKWQMSLFVSDSQRNYFINLYATESKLSLKRRIDRKNDIMHLYVKNRCIGYYKMLIPDANSTLKEVVSNHISQDTQLGIAFRNALKI